MTALTKVRNFLFPAVRPRTALDVRYEKAFLFMKPSLVDKIREMQYQMPEELAAVVDNRIDTAGSSDDLERIYVECTFIIEAYDRMWSGRDEAWPNANQVLNDALRLQEAARSTVVDR